jgi:hypothetical protein
MDGRPREPAALLGRIKAWSRAAPHELQSPGSASAASEHARSLDADDDSDDYVPVSGDEGESLGRGPGIARRTRAHLNLSSVPPEHVEMIVHDPLGEDESLFEEEDEAAMEEDDEGVSESHPVSGRQSIGGHTMTSGVDDDMEQYEEFLRSLQHDREAVVGDELSEGEGDIGSVAPSDSDGEAPRSVARVRVAKRPREAEEEDEDDDDDSFRADEDDEDDDEDEEQPAPPSSKRHQSSSPMSAPGALGVTEDELEALLLEARTETLPDYAVASLLAVDEAEVRDRRIAREAATSAVPVAAAEDPLWGGDFMGLSALGLDLVDQAAPDGAGKSRAISGMHSSLFHESDSSGSDSGGGITTDSESDNEPHVSVSPSRRHRTSLRHSLPSVPRLTRRDQFAFFTEDQEDVLRSQLAATVQLLAQSVAMCGVDGVTLEHMEEVHRLAALFRDLQTTSAALRQAVESASSAAFAQERREVDVAAAAVEPSDGVSHIPLPLSLFTRGGGRLTRHAKQQARDMVEKHGPWALPLRLLRLGRRQRRRAFAEGLDRVELPPSVFVLSGVEDVADAAKAALTRVKTIASRRLQGPSVDIALVVRGMPPGHLTIPLDPFQAQPLAAMVPCHNRSAPRRGMVQELRVSFHGRGRATAQRLLQRCAMACRKDGLKVTFPAPSIHEGGGVSDFPEELPLLANVTQAWLAPRTAPRLEVSVCSSVHGSFSHSEELLLVAGALRFGLNSLAVEERVGAGWGNVEDPAGAETQVLALHRCSPDALIHQWIMPAKTPAQIRSHLKNMRARRAALDSDRVDSLPASSTLPLLAVVPTGASNRCLFAIPPSTEPFRVIPPSPGPKSTEHLRWALEGVRVVYERGLLGWHWTEEQVLQSSFSQLRLALLRQAVPRSRRRVDRMSPELWRGVAPHRSPAAISQACLVFGLAHDEPVSGQGRRSRGAAVAERAATRRRESTLDKLLSSEALSQEELFALTALHSVFPGLSLSHGPALAEACGVDVGALPPTAGFFGNMRVWPTTVVPGRASARELEEAGVAELWYEGPPVPGVAFAGADQQQQQPVAPPQTLEELKALLRTLFTWNDVRARARAAACVLMLPPGPFGGIDRGVAEDGEPEEDAEENEDDDEMWQEEEEDDEAEDEEQQDDTLSRQQGVVEACSLGSSDDDADSEDSEVRLTTPARASTSLIGALRLSAQKHGGSSPAAFHPHTDSYVSPGLGMSDHAAAQVLSRMSNSMGSASGSLPIGLGLTQLLEQSNATRMSRLPQ